VYDAVKEVLEREGIWGLYSGLSSSLLGIAVTNGYISYPLSTLWLILCSRVYYYFYERSRGIILKSRVGSKGLSTMESILTGLIAGGFLVFISILSRT